MRVAIVDTTLMHPPTGGAQTFLCNLGGALRAQGLAVHVISEKGPDRSVADRLAAAGVEVHTNLWHPRHLPEERATRLAAWLRAQDISAHLISISADVGWLVLPLLEHRVTTIAVVHSDGPAFYEPLKHYAGFIDRAVGVSEHTFRRIVAECGVAPERARRIPYGVGALPLAEARVRWETAARPFSTLRVGYVGRLEQRLKRAQDIVPLVAELARRAVPFQFHVIGDGEERAWLERELRGRRLEGLVQLWGWRTPEEVRAHLRDLDVLVLFSAVEGLPLALLEAMGHAVVPVVTRTHSGNAEVVRDGENGFLVPIGDVTAFAARLQELADDRERLRRLRKTAWDTGELYSIERMTALYMACLTGAESPAESGTWAPRPGTGYPIMPSCRSPYPTWLRRIKARVLASIVTLRPAAR